MELSRQWAKIILRNGFSYSKNDADGYRQWYTMTPLTDRKRFNTAFAEWMLEDPSTENVEWISKIANQTSDTTMAILNETASYADYSETLRSLERQLPLLLVMREEWEEIVSTHASKNLPTANVVAFGRRKCAAANSARHQSHFTRE